MLFKGQESIYETTRSIVHRRITEPHWKQAIHLMEDIGISLVSNTVQRVQKERENLAEDHTEAMQRVPARDALMTYVTVEIGALCAEICLLNIRIRLAFDLL